MQRFSILSIVLPLGCSPQPVSMPTPTSLPSTMSEAHDVLIKFFDFLNAKEYAEADALYGGDYEQLQLSNPEADPADHTLLWTSACERAGLQCLKVRTATFNALQGDTYIFQVEFSNADGSLFVFGPCCGADKTEMPPVSLFEYRVSRADGLTFQVLDLPPYTP